MTTLLSIHLEKFKQSQENITVFLANGVRINGKLVDFDASGVVLTSEDSADEDVFIHMNVLASFLKDRPDTRRNKNRKLQPRLQEGNEMHGNASQHRRA